MTGLTVAAAPLRRAGGRHRSRRRAFTWRLLRLHLRARQIGWFAAGLGVVALAGWWAADALVHGAEVPDAARRVPAVVAAPLLGAIIASTGLGGADEELERSTAWRWRAARAAHVLVIAAATGVALGAVTLWEPETYGAHANVRNTLACVGIVAASAVVLGARLAWAPVFAYVVTVYFAAPKPLAADTAWWTWPVQPSSSSIAWYTAATLFVVGSVLYAITGAHPASTRDE